MARKFHHSFEVCSCKQVTLGEIIHAIKEKGAKTLEDLENLTDAGSSCKSCKNEESDVSLAAVCGAQAVGGWLSGCAS